jgi:hypothetical protein
MTGLAQDHRGFPVPWFVQWMDDGAAAPYGVGEPDFRVIDTPKLHRAVQQRLCWICGQRLGRYLAFVIGPMCAINRINSEPPSHLECAQFAVRACPFLMRPRMRRNTQDLPEKHDQPTGFHLDRNPGAACIWVTKTYRVFRPGQGNPGVLFNLGEPVNCWWFANGRPATRDEIEESIDTGFPALLAMCESPREIAVLDEARRGIEPLLPR